MGKAKGTQGNLSFPVKTKWSPVVLCQCIPIDLTPRVLTSFIIFLIFRFLRCSMCLKSSALIAAPIFELFCLSLGVGTKLTFQFRLVPHHFKNAFLSQIIRVKVLHIVWTSNKEFKELIQCKMQGGGLPRLELVSLCYLPHVNDLDTTQGTLKIRL